MFTIGIDIGGMSVKVGLVDEKGIIIAKNVVKTEKDADLAIKKMSEQIFVLLKDNGLTLDDIDGIGIGCPGAVSGEKGFIDILPNLEWSKLPIVDKIKEYINKPVRISNDANVAVLAEAVHGAAKGCTNCIMFTLGTGVGGGVIINKKLYEGKDSKGAELGHSTLILDGEPCSCGRSGCVETYVSATALMKQTRSAMISDKKSLMWEYCENNIDNVNGKTAFECAKKGDTSAETVVANYVKYLSESMMNMMNIFRPDVFLIGGGVSNQGDYLINRIKDYCEKFSYGYKLCPKPEIKVATLGNDAGIIGAAELIR